jgi:glutamate racemase
MIGLFDSGIGGLTVVREVIKRLPQHAFIYFGDTARAPYGNKSAEVVAEYGLEAAKFLIDKGAKVLVVACNTVSAVGIEVIKKAYPNVPVFDVVTPAISAVSSQSKGHHIGVMGTRALVNSGIYQNLLNGSSKFKVSAHTAPLLVPLVEEGWLDKPETKRIVKSYLAPFKRAQVDILVLACTHYPLLKKLIAAKAGKRIRIIDPACETAQMVADWLQKHPEVDKELKRGDGNFYVSDLTPNFQTIAEKWLGRKITLEKVYLN